MFSSIGRLSAIIGAAIFILFAFVVGLDRISLSQVKVSGPAYQRIVAAKDLVSDLLPPPLFLVEADVVVQQAGASREQAVQARARLEELRKSYEERRAFWSASADLPPEIKVALNGEAHQAASAFWSEAFDRLLPALERGDVGAASAARARLSDLFATHYEVVNKEVKLANDFAQTTEAAAVEWTARLSQINLVAAALALSGMLAIFFLVRARLVEPIKVMAAYMVELTRGPVDRALCDKGRRDEIGEMCRAIAYFKAGIDKVREAEAEAEAQRAKVAEQLKDREAGAKWYIENRDFFFKEYTNAMTLLSEGDLEVRLDKPFIPDYETLRETFNKAVDRLHTTMQGIVTTAGAMSVSTVEIGNAIGELSKRNESQAATLAETAATIDGITQTVRQAAGAASQARDIVSLAKTDAQRGEKIVRDAIDAMDGLKHSSEKIGQIVGLIDEIAFQTNLLALNAGVEAARAGDAGKGFAVVATEVRALAQRSAEAAREINALISDSNGKVQAGVSLVTDSGEALRSIVKQVATIDSTVNEIAAGAEAQSSSLREVNIAMQEIDRVTQQNAAMAEETNAAGQTLSADSTQLGELIERFKIGAAHAAAPAARRARAKPALKVAASGGGAALRRAEAAADDWEEF